MSVGSLSQSPFCGASNPLWLSELSIVLWKNASSQDHLCLATSLLLMFLLDETYFVFILHYSARTVITNYYRLGGLNNRNVFSHGSRSYIAEVQHQGVGRGWFPPKLLSLAVLMFTRHSSATCVCVQTSSS